MMELRTYFIGMVLRLINTQLKYFDNTCLLTKNKHLKFLEI